MKKINFLITDFFKKYPHKSKQVHRSLNLLEKYKNNPTRVFLRDCFDDGHFTGSMLVMNKDKTRLLLMHHIKLGTWQQFGGHADGDSDIRSVAVREFEEEAGISESDAEISQEILNIDIQLIPARKDEPEHYHYDVSFLALVDDDVVFEKQETEVQDIKWFDLSEVMEQLDS